MLFRSKQRGSETYTSPKLARNFMSRNGSARLLLSGEKRSCYDVFIFMSSQEMNAVESIERHTTIVRTRPLPLNRSNDTRFDFMLPSCLIHISAVMGPLSVWMVRFLRSASEAMPEDGGGGGKERSRIIFPSTAITGLGPHFDTWT